MERAPSLRTVRAVLTHAALRSVVHPVRQYIHDAAVRDRIHLQLNRGESRHTLARRLSFANQGSFRTGDHAEIMNKVSALSVLSNSVPLWNTRQPERVIGALEEAAGEPVNLDDLERISPLLQAHVIPSGTYRFGDG